ncbi:hypothetical protein C8R43DRAFT_1059603 [Mycena crocata]|nr:hypothetical protein C8R43DRAFT_1059603 [Mycena crocata]
MPHPPIQTHTEETETTLPSLAAWSAQHIRAVFEAPSDAHFERAVATTFSQHLSASLNGTQFDFAGLCSLVASMRESAPGGLKVEWTRAEGTPDDIENRNGSLVGEYIIRGIWRSVPGSEQPREFERHKKVDVRIESQSAESGSDSRIIVKLAIIASDIPVDK